MNIMILNGPNINRLGSREPEIYGTTSIEELKVLLTSFNTSQVKVDFRQTNSEAELIQWIHQAADLKADIVLNPAAFTHYSYALYDACIVCQEAGSRIIEVHMSNPAAREHFRHKSVISPAVYGTIAGFGIDSYRLAINWLLTSR